MYKAVLLQLLLLLQGNGGLHVENRQFFPTPLLFWLKFGGVPFGVDP